ncbi:MULTISPECIES: hypothetical protein [Mycobacteriaceae]|uniref:Uncharacterized protein n=1 Tax=Mycolicibacter virginiensis TaxID=1795032 RepID=A0A9X7IP85_9MYCO|nr:MULTISPECIES: hypothetical protein [Mycobacteriaceae]OBG34708.1 hypothetical protein A5671_03860 [Mycolicibacter heraklionensis]OBJ29276.1 hypothetical protein A5631_17860 [Mycolicibacter heraklionensis]PQM52866.1 hypothetical protein C5U48_07700 [Mycolicibacter virginiensis]ULP49572.1 hypothetical protein MJO54_11360 [Mycolicibacter virginiensis]
MSRIRKYLTVAAGAAAGLFLTALASSATANADTAPINPGLSGVVEQMVASSTSLPQQLLQTTTGALSGTTFAPPATPGQAPLATATFNVPPSPSAMPQQQAATGLPGLGNLPASLSSVLPFPLPNFGGSAPVPAAPTAFAPTGYLPSVPVAPVAPVTPMEVMLIPGLP